MNDIADIYRSRIIFAVTGKSSELAVADTAALERICEHLADCEEAAEILTVKGHRRPGMTPVEAAKAVPENAQRKLKLLFGGE